MARRDPRGLGRRLAHRPAALLLASALALCCAPTPGHARDGATPDSGAAAMPEGWAADTVPDSASLVAGDWRLFSPVFAALPADGYPIRFAADGRVGTENLAGVTGWMLAGGRLLLHGPKGHVAYQFQWSDSAGEFERHLMPQDAGAPSMRIVRRDAHAGGSRGAGERARHTLLRDLREQQAPLTLPDAAVSTEDEAQRLALEAYFHAGGLRALEAARVIDVFRLGIDVADFARKGDRVWEVRIHELGDLSAIIWIHAETRQAYFLIPRRNAPGGVEPERER